MHPRSLFLDEETGLYNNRARIYAPRQGRFLQRDPLGYPDGMNSYAAYHVMRQGTDAWGLATWATPSLINAHPNPKSLYSNHDCVGKYWLFDGPIRKVSYSVGWEATDDLFIAHAEAWSTSNAGKTFDFDNSERAIQASSRLEILITCICDPESKQFKATHRLINYLGPDFDAPTRSQQKSITSTIKNSLGNKLENQEFNVKNRFVMAGVIYEVTEFDDYLMLHSTIYAHGQVGGKIQLPLEQVLDFAKPKGPTRNINNGSGIEGVNTNIGVHSASASTGFPITTISMTWRCQ